MNTKLKAGVSAALALALVGCTSQTTRWGNPALFGGAGTADSYQVLQGIEARDGRLRPRLDSTSRRTETVRPVHDSEGIHEV